MGSWIVNHPPLGTIVDCTCFTKRSPRNPRPLRNLAAHANLLLLLPLTFRQEFDVQPSNGISHGHANREYRLGRSVLPHGAPDFPSGVQVHQEVLESQI